VCESGSEGRSREDVNVEDPRALVVELGSHPLNHLGGGAPPAGGVSEPCGKLDLHAVSPRSFGLTLNPKPATTRPSQRFSAGSRTPETARMTDPSLRQVCPAVAVRFVQVDSSFVNSNIGGSTFPTAFGSVHGRCR